MVRVSPCRASSRARRSFLGTGRNPSKTNRAVSCPDTASAVTQADAPGTGTTRMPRSWAAFTNCSPGSLMQGIPASLHRAQSSPASMRCKMASPWNSACS